MPFRTDTGAATAEEAPADVAEETEAEAAVETAPEAAGATAPVAAEARAPGAGEETAPGEPVQPEAEASTEEADEPREEPSAQTGKDEEA
jgi:hypothetical protein